MNSSTQGHYVFPRGLESSTFLSSLANIDHRQRRYLLWHRFVPRLGRYCYRYSSLAPTSAESIDRAKDILHRSRFWLASPADFNDPFDCKVHVLNETDPKVKRQKIESLIKQFKPELTWIQRKAEINRFMSRDSNQWFDWSKISIEGQLNGVGVTCFSDDPRNLLMWSHYARNHSGLCYQFEVANDLDVFARALSVEYTEKYPDINFFTYKLQDLINILLSKYKDWKYEIERRIVAPSGAHQFLPFSACALTGIILGSRMDADTEQKLLELVGEREKLGLSPIRIFRAQQHARAYRLTLQKYNPS